MSLTPKQNLLQAHQLVLYQRAVHPDQLGLKGRRVVKHAAYELEAWVIEGGHVLRFERGGLCASELVIEQERSIPTSGILAAFPCPSEKDFDHDFDGHDVTYMCSIQSETLPESLFRATLAELQEFGKQHTALAWVWEDEAGRCLSLVDVQRYADQVHAQAYHCIASSGLVLRTQSLFEIAPKG